MFSKEDTVVVNKISSVKLLEIINLVFDGVKVKFFKRVFVLYLAEPALIEAASGR